MIYENEKEIIFKTKQNIINNWYKKVSFYYTNKLKNNINRLYFNFKNFYLKNS